MKNISELFDYIEKTPDDEVRSQLIEFMKNHFHQTSVNLGTANPINRYKLRIRRLCSETRNLADLINFCFVNDFKTAVKEINTGEKQTVGELKYETYQSLSKKINISVSTLRNAVKAKELQSLIIPGTGKRRKTRRFTPKQIEDYLRKLSHK